VRRWAREGVLRPGYCGGWQWTRDGETVASIQMRAEQDRVILIYRHRSGDAEWKDEHYAVRIVRTPCNLGGSRSWFICPAVGCGRDAGGRATRRADRLRARLGWEPGILNGEGGKPKWMRWWTFERLAAKYDQLVGRSMQAMMLKFGGFRDFPE
jgi:hypothetical protein